MKRFLILFCSLLILCSLSMDVRAADNAEESEEIYTYYWTEEGKRFNSSGDYFLYDVRFEYSSSFPVVGYYVESVHCIYVYYYDSSYTRNYAKFSCTSYNLYENTGVSNALNYYVVGNSNTSLNWDSPVTSSCDVKQSSNIPIFTSDEDILNYLKNGDESGIINKPVDGDIQTDDTFALTGFTADNTITASWTGTTHDDKSADYAEMFVELTAGYAYVNAPGQIATTEPYVGEYPIADKTFTKLRSELQSSDDSIFLRYLEVVPYYKLESGWLSPPYRGNSCFIWLNSDGSIEKITNTFLPEFSDSISDKTLGYLQDVRYVEDYNTHDFTITWSVLNNYDDSYHIQIMADVATKDSLSSSIVVTKCSWIEFSDNLQYSKGMLSGNTVSVVNECLGSTDYFHYDVYRYYLRIVKYDEFTQSYKVGGWVKLAVDHDSPSSGSPVLSDVITGDFDSDTGDWITDNESDDSYHDKQNGQSGESIIDNPNYIIGTDDAGNLDMVTLGKSFLNSVNGLFSYVGRLPSLIGSLFVFIPASILTLIGLGIIIAIILRILGR